jgi:hypothetical protein
VCAGPIGSVEVAELDWGNPQQAEALHPPFDYIIGTDVVCDFFLVLSRFLSHVIEASYVFYYPLKMDML